MCDFPACSWPAVKNGLCVHHNRVYGSVEVKSKEKTSIPKNSEKRAEQEKLYAKECKKFKKENPICQVAGCENKTDHVHHKKGRIEKLLNDKSLWLAVCEKHHRKIELEPLWAIENEYSVSRHKI